MDIKYILQEKGVFNYKYPYKPDEHPNDHSDTINRWTITFFE